MSAVPVPDLNLHFETEEGMFTAESLLRYHLFVCALSGFLCGQARELVPSPGSTRPTLRLKSIQATAINRYAEIWQERSARHAEVDVRAAAESLSTIDALRAFF
jgi:hypothetical protein